LRPRLRQILWGVLPTVFWACLCFQLIRLHLCERYLVASGSMEPTIHGDPHGGDRVLVDKTAFWGQAPRAFELVVVEAPRPGAHHLVKRFVAEGPCRVSLAEGDLFIGRGGGLERLVKYPGEHPDMSVTAYLFVASDRGAQKLDWLHSDPERWSLGPLGLHLHPCQDPELPLSADAQESRRSRRPQDDFLPGFLSLDRAVDVSFLNRMGHRLARGRSYPRDIGMELSLELEAGCSELVLVIEHRGVYYPLHYSVEGSGRLMIPDQPAVTFAGPALKFDRVFDLSYGFLDGRFFFRIGESPLLLHHPYPLPTDFGRLRTGHAGEPRFANLLHVGLVGAGGTISRMRIFHDLHYQPDPDRVFELGPDEIFVLGDNSLESSDSRDLSGIRDAARIHFVRNDLIGRPIAVIGPWSEIRWLSH